MKRGEIYWANLNPRSGSEQFGKRPVIIISHDAFNENENWHSIIVIPISTSIKQGQRGLSVVLLPKGTAGLAESSVALCHQITTLDRAKFTERVGTLSKKIILDIEAAIKVALAMDDTGS